MTRAQIFLICGVILLAALAGLALWEVYGVPILLKSAFLLC